MPTADRRYFAERAIRYFERQTYPNRELVIVDDGKSPIAELAEGRPQIRYICLEQRATIGTKRNLACESALGEVIVHWDDDDWYSASRLRLQMDLLKHAPELVCGVRDWFSTIFVGIGRFNTAIPQPGSHGWLERACAIVRVHGTIIISRT